MNERHDPETPSPGLQDHPRPATRVAFVLAVALLAGLLVTSAQTPQSTSESRLGGRIELIELIRDEQAMNAAMAAKLEDLTAQVSDIRRSAGDGGPALPELQERVDALAAPAGMTALVGPGVTVTLRDSTASPKDGAGVNDYVIHEQDLQAVINGLWAGGAEAMAVNGQRILTTTAIRCVGNVLLLHGATYSPPYVIEAVGDPVSMVEGLERDPAVARFAQAVQSFQLGYEVQRGDQLRLPAYEGSSSVQLARPVDAGPGP